MIRIFNKILVLVIQTLLVYNLFYANITLAQEQQPTAGNLLLEATKEQYKLDNEIRADSWSKVQEQWATTLAEIEQFINSDSRHSQDDINHSLDDIDRLIDQARDSIKAAKDSLRTNNLLLEGLGKTPISGQEPENLTVTRNQLSHIKSFYENQIEKLNQLVINAENLKIALSQLRRTEFTEIMKTRVALPFLPSTIATAIKTITSRTAGFVLSSRQWAKEHSRSTELWTTRISILVAVVLAYFLGKLISRRFGRNPEIEHPSQSRKLSAAIAEGVATGIIPITIICILYALLNSVYSIDSEKFHNVVNTILIHLLILSVAVTLCIAILSPKYPIWRLTSLSARTSSRVGKGLIFLIFVVILDSLFFRFLNIVPETALNFDETESRTTSFVSTIFNILKASALVYICRPSVWQNDNQVRIEEEQTAMDTIWSVIRIVIILLAMGSIIASLMGHVYLGQYITFGIFITIILLGVGFLIREAAHELIGFIVKQKWLRQTFGFRIVTLQSIKFWAEFIIDPIIFGAAFLVIMPFWGVPVEKLLQIVKTAFEGFNIGELRISLKGILLSIVVFFILMRLTKFIQKFIKQNLFPKSSQTRAQQHNTLTIINYLGVIIALSAAVAALGIDFQTIAVILGALSVGIGFGLRNVVSNFVSGLLLLVEKPIKVGDWIQIGQHEGFVKDLKFRSTELETFQQASVIIPNADLISQPVVNMTFADEKGRIEVPVSVAYHSDPRQVHDLLIDIAKQHPQTLDDPEPFVVFMNFGESSLDFELRAFTNEVISKVIIASDIRFEIEKTLNEKGIEIPFPQRVVHFKDEAKETKQSD